MADSNSIIALKIGTQRVAMASFAAKKNGALTLKNVQSIDVLADPSNDGMRNAEVRGAVAQLAKSLKAGKSKVRASVSGHSVITKFVKLPPIDSDELTDLVTMEAQQQIPFPLDEGAWDWAEIEGGGIEKEVLLVAIRQEVLDDISESVTGAGLSLSDVAASPTSVYNAFRYNYPDVTESVLLVDIGAKSTELIYIDGQKFFMQGINTAGTTGASLTSAIAKEFSVSFPEAEAHKVNSGMVSLGNTTGLDESTAALASFIRDQINRLPGEISRRTNFFRSQQGGNAPTKIYVAGGGANLGYLVDFLQEKLSLPVEPFNPLRRVEGAGEDVAAQAHELGELVGLAVQEVGKGPLKIDLVPTSVAGDRANAKKKPWLLGASGLLLAGLGAWGAMNASAASKAEENLAAMEERQAELAGPARKISSWNKGLGTVKLIGDDLAKAQLERTRWVELLGELRDYFASDTVWITELRPWTNYVPGEPESGKSYTKGGFGRLAFSESIVDVKSGSTKGWTEDPVINAVRIDGFWRQGVDGKQHRAVAEILGKIKTAVKEAEDAVADSGEEPETFFQLLKEQGIGRSREVVPLPDAEILVNNNTTLAPDAYGAPFTMILPLREPLSFEELRFGKGS